MAFSSKTDLVGLASVVTANSIKLRSNGENGSNQVLQIHASDGSYLGDEVYGSVKAPNCEYAIVKAGTLAGVQLGKVYNSLNSMTPYAVNNVQINTGAGTEPTITATAVQLEPAASRAYCVYPLDSIPYSPARHASTFGVFEYIETVSHTLQTCNYAATVGLTPTTINGDPVSSDAVEGVETLTMTFWTASQTQQPSISGLMSGWHQTGEWTCNGPDSGLFQWTGTLTHYLSGSHPATPTPSN